MRIRGMESGPRGKEGFCPACLHWMPEGPDACLGELPNVSFACCGHGDLERDHAYVVIGGMPCEPGSVTLRGDDARAYFREVL